MWTTVSSTFTDNLIVANVFACSFLSSDFSPSVLPSKPETIFVLITTAKSRLTLSLAITPVSFMNVERFENVEEIYEVAKVVTVFFSSASFKIMIFFRLSLW